MRANCTVSNEEQTDTRGTFSRGTAPRRHASRRSANLISPLSFIFARLMGANLLSLPRYRRVPRLCQRRLPRKDERKGFYFLTRRGYTSRRDFSWKKDPLSFDAAYKRRIHDIAELEAFATPLEIPSIV